MSAWLTEVQLQQYVSAFAQNAISGSVLVDITAEDLDYMEIKALGHRKILLKGVDDLRKNKFYSAAALSSPQKMPDMLRTSSNPNMGEGSSDRALMSTSMQMSGSKYSPTEQSASVKSTHWSHLEPISANKVNKILISILGARFYHAHSNLNLSVGEQSKRRRYDQPRR